MDNKKDIGKLFKERLDNLESKPNEAIWTALEKELQKENKRFFPLWLRLSLLLLLVSAGSIAIYNYTRGTNSMDNNSNSKTTIANTKDTIKNNLKEATNTLTGKEDTYTLDATKTSNNSQQFKDSLLTVSGLKTQTIINTSKRNTSVSSLNSKKTPSIINNSNGQDTASTTTHLKSSQSYNKDPKAIIETKLKSNNTSSTSRNLKPNVSNSNYRTIPKRNYNLNESATLAVLKSLGMTDLSNAKITVSLIPFGHETKDKISSVETGNTYSIETFGGPLFLNAKGSSLDNRLDENQKTSDISFTYGAAINYKLSERSSIRLGIVKTDLTHITDNVTSTNNDGSVITLNNILGLALDFNSLEALNTNNALGAGNSIGLRHELSYFEIPLEIEYRAITKKIAVGVFGGVSFLSLNENKVFIESSNGFSTFIGNANNLNKFNLSLNTGVTFSTKIFTKTHLNLRPTARYYFKTIEKTALKFNPFTYGVSLGLRYSF